jgi:WD40 repeat protein
MTSLSGHQEQLPFQINQIWGINWLSRDSYANPVYSHSDLSFSSSILGQRSDIEERTLDGRLVRRLVSLRSFLALPIALAASSDGKRLAFGENSMASMMCNGWRHSRTGNKGWINILNLDTGRIRRLRGPEMIEEMAWSPDGKSLAVVGRDVGFTSENTSKGSLSVISGL